MDFGSRLELQRPDPSRHPSSEEGWPVDGVADGSGGGVSAVVTVGGVHRRDGDGPHGVDGFRRRCPFSLHSSCLYLYPNRDDSDLFGRGSRMGG